MPNSYPPPVIALGQQPNGFFPKRYLVSKLETARNLQKEIGGKIIFFYHDSDSDYRETITVLKDKNTQSEFRLNFTQENKIQKNFSPLYLKRIPENWKAEILKQLPRALEENQIKLFSSIGAKNTADFCLEMYKKLGLLEGVEIIRSSNQDFRQKAPNLTNDYYADVKYENEIVRAKVLAKDNKKFGLLHHGGGKNTEFEISEEIPKNQITPGRDERFGWMNSVIKSTHYICGNSEFEYLKKEKFPEVKFLKRDQVEDESLAWLPS
ncbi:MAG: hypothetical protein JNN11_02975 [Candidatus Doudnabacteria bacterium]|nr:hypothetical protein [Candidatus Doudnabacteria bacterium]